MENKFMAEALKEAYYGIEHGHGGPFGAVVVKDGKIIGRGHNCVVKEKDPTLHGEMMAIKDACKRLSAFDLSGTQIYTTAEPCPMCLGAILWAGIDKIYYGCDKIDTETIGFRDKEFYDSISGKKTGLQLEELEKEACQQLFEAYQKMDGKIQY